MLHEHFRLSSPNLEDHAAARQEMGACLVQEGADDACAIGAAVEGGERVAPDLAGEGRDFAGGDVGEIRDDEAVLAGEGGEEVAVDKSDTVRKAELGGVFGGEGEGIGRDVDGIDGGGWPLGGEGEGDDAAAGAGIEDGCGLESEGEEELDQVLGLRPGDEGAGIAEEGASMELDGAEEMLERLAGGAAFHQVAQGVEFAFAEGAVKFEVEVDAFFPEHVGEQMFGVQARAFNAMLLKITGGGGDDFLHVLHGIVTDDGTLPWERQSPRRRRGRAVAGGWASPDRLPPLDQSRIRAAIDRQVRAGDVSRFRTGDERDHRATSSTVP